MTSGLYCKRRCFRCSLSILLVTFLSVSASWVYGEEDLYESYGDEDFVSIATGRKQLIAKAPSVSSVLTSSQIKKIGAKDISEVLETIPGVHISRAAGGYIPIFIFRGIYSEYNPQVLVLINGQPITSLLFGDRGLSWAGMSVENISRVEVIRGPGSAIYGADSYAGTINIITKNADEIDGVKAGYSFGSFQSHDAWFQYGGGLTDRWNIAFSAEIQKTDGHDELIEEDLQTLIDSLVGTNVSNAPNSVNLGVKNYLTQVEINDDRWIFRLGYHKTDDGGLGAGANSALDPDGRGEGSRLNLDAIYKDPAFAENTELEVFFRYLKMDNKFDFYLFPPGFDYTSVGGFSFPEGVIASPEYYEEHIKVGSSIFYSGFKDHQLALGIGFAYQDQYRVEENKNHQFINTPLGFLPIPIGGYVSVTDTMPFNQEKLRKISYLYIQDEFNFAPDWSLTAGVRYDNYSDFGDTFNPRLALVWQTSLDLTTKILYGRAFRAPSFAELFNINNPVAIGNENLDPEVINTYELAFDYRVSAKLRGGLNIFYYKMEDIIRFNPTVAENSGDQTGRGLEFEFEWQYSDDLTISGNYAYQKSIDKLTDSEAPNAPKSQIYIRADYRISHGWSSDVQLNRVMNRKRAPDDPRPTVDDYSTVDWTVRADRIFPTWELALSVRNLTDEEVYEPSLSPGYITYDLPQGGRTYFAEVRKQF